MSVLETTRAILATHGRWIIPYLPATPTPTQTPRDLIVAALRRVGFDVLASASKATQIVHAAEEETTEL